MKGRLAGAAAARLARHLPSSEEGVAVAGGAALAFGAQVLGAVLAYLAQVLLARWLGAGEFGTYTFTVGWSTIAAILAGLGLGTAMLRFVPLYRGAGETGRLRGLLRTALLATLGAGGALALLGSALVLLGPGPGGEGGAVLLGLWAVPILALLTLQQEIARALGRAALAYGPPLVLRPALLLAAAAALVAAGKTLSAVTALGLALLAALAAVGLQGALIGRHLGPDLREEAPIIEARHWLGTAAPMLLVSGFVVLLLQSDVVAVGAFLGPHAAGVYGAAAKTAALVSLVPIAATAIAAPVLGAMIAQGRRTDAQRLASAVAGWSFWPALVIGALLALGAGPVLGLFGAGFSAATPSLRILLAGQVLSAGAGAVGWLMLLGGHQREAARVYGTIAAGHLALLAVAVPLLGMSGAAIVTTMSYAVWNLWLNALVVRRLGLHASIGFVLLRGSGVPREPVAVTTQERPGEGGH